MHSSIVASEYLTGGTFIPLMQHNDVWKRMRRVADKILSKTMASSFYPAQEQEAVRLVWNMLKNTGPKQWDSELQRAASSVVVSMVYGLSILESSDDPAIGLRVNEFILRVGRASIPGTHLVEVFPWMRYFPAFICKWKRDSQMWYRRDTEFFKALFAGAKDRMEKGDDRDSFASYIIRGQEHYELSDTEISWLSATIYAGGAETSATAMSWFMLAMVAHPEVQKKCQEELDAVIGRSRTPRLSDQNDLPYIRATAREVLRWRPLAPLGIPHQLAKDDWHEGSYIPKNTIVIPNIWAMNHDKDTFGLDADMFRPERHLGPDGKLAPSPPDTKQGVYIWNVTFGYGSRICPGRYVANSFLFVNIASILWAANISPEKDVQGKCIPPDTSDAAALNDGIFLKPRPFKCCITPRFPEAKEVLEQIMRELESGR
ncbi:hypothetical protein V5O48_008375 [Marasmius crinis-equi]|uniref:Cytochrome P450 n=1 Tax=Marasmius crinis-equi TaxID=585013 RepID=A0ABR3FEQ2_9AGAR